MKARVKPTEVRQVIGLLEAEHPDVEELAKEVVLTLKQRWIEEEYYVTCMYDPNAKAVYTYGPYSTKNQAQKALKSLASAGPIPSQGWVQRLTEPNDG